MKEVLVAEEFHFDTFMRKFPGGGLDFGEGIRDCVVRELREELSIDVTEMQLLHTTEQFVQSAFYDDQQVIAVYYLVAAPEELILRYREEFVAPTENGQERFKWVKVVDLYPDDFTFEVDKEAIKKFRVTINKEYLPRRHRGHGGL
jgi:ADP-ribose pyrophosphatase YjhB (NUDIX family)